MRFVAALFGILVLMFMPSAAWSQCSGQAPGNTYCGNPTGAQALPGWKATNLAPATVPDSFCVVDRTGASDMGSCINAAISAAKNCGSGSTGYGTVYLRAGTYLVTTPIVPKSCVKIEGDGPGRTILLTNSNAPFGPPVGQQLVHFSLDNVMFKDSGTHPNAVVMNFPSLQDSRLTNLGFTGYTGGTLMAIATDTVVTFDDSSAMWNNSNAIFNYFLNWHADSCGNCISEAGRYGSTPTAVPPNSSNVPSQVVTLNRFDNISIWNCGGTCFNFVKAADSETLTNIITVLNNNNVAFQIGGDNANFPGNNYVNSIHLQATISAVAPGTTATFFQFGDWTFGNVLEVEHDMLPANITPVTLQAGVTQANYTLCGKNPYAAYLGTFNTNSICLKIADYTLVDNGTAALPVLGFFNDASNGFYLPAAGVFGFSKAISSGANGGTGGRLILNGSASGSATISVAAATGTTTFQLPTTDGSSTNVLKTDGSGVTSWGVVAGSEVTGAALTKTDDTNVTLTLGGTPATALLRAASITAGWTGQLALNRGGTNASLTGSNGGIVYSTATALAILTNTATAGQIIRSGAAAAPTWSTATYPATTTAGSMLVSSTANTVTATATPVLGVAGSTVGSIGLQNATSGTVTLQPVTGALGTVTINVPAAAGTLAVSATAPLALSAAGALSITGVANAVLAGSSPAFTQTPTLGTNGGTGGQITLNGATSGSGIIRVAAAAGAGIVFQLPSSNGSNTNVLQTDGTGVLSWAAAGSGTVTTLTAGTAITFSSGATCTTTCTINNGGVTSIAGNTGAFTLSTGLTNATNALQIDKATAANLEGGTSNKVLTTDIIYDAATAITFNATQTWDFSTFLNATETLTANITSLTCSNIKASQSGAIVLTQDGTGSRTMVAGWCSQFRWQGGVRGVLSTAANSVDTLFYQCVSTSICYVSLSKAQAN